MWRQTIRSDSNLPRGEALDERRSAGDIGETRQGERSGRNSDMQRPAAGGRADVRGKNSGRRGVESSRAVDAGRRSHLRSRSISWLDIPTRLGTVGTPPCDPYPSAISAT